MENETVLRAQAAQRRTAEEERRREAARQRADDEERARQAGTPAPRGGRGTRGRGRGVGRASSSGYGSSSYTAAGSSSIGSSRGSLQPPRPSSGIGRGIGSVRGRKGPRT
jgi:septal ring factor EnvC (AmiA/AmiB activator)